MSAKALRRRQAVNKGVARFIPFVLAGFVAYVSYVVVGPLTVNYLINTPPNAGVEPRIPVAVALPITYFVLLILMAMTYFRLLQVVFWDPGFIPEGDRPPEPDEVDEHGGWAIRRRSEKRPSSASTTEPWLLDYEGILQHRSQPPPGLESYYNKDVFVCDQNGLPLWCGVCCNWKPDRAHHSSDCGRCVMKMDHFCPWVGGVVGENSYKFFVQFIFYSCLYTSFTLVMFAYFVAEAQVDGYSLQVQWAVALGLAGFFFLFSIGMFVMSVQMTLQNVTTIESFDHSRRTMFLAVALPPELQSRPIPPPPPAVTRSETPPSRFGECTERPLTSEIDDPAHAEYFNQAPRTRRQRSSSFSAVRTISHSVDLPHGPPPIWTGSITYPLWLPADRPPLPAPIPRSFAILRTPPGLNPWDLGASENWTSIFGEKPHQWLTPFRRSPCKDHSSPVSSYPLGWQFQELLHDAGLMRRTSALDDDRSRSGRGRRRVARLSEGWQNGERPDGWFSEKEARRVRNEQRFRERALRHL